jgi:hypothetical protein
MNKKLHFTVPVMAFTALTTWNLFSAEGVVTPAMAGHWEGNARIIVSWCQQTNLSVTVDIRTNGTVTGKIGDATLIAGGLDGAIVAAEGITRSQVTMICDFNNGSFNGQIDTDGQLCVFSSEKTRKEKMALTAIGLKLIRLPSRP